LRYTVLSKKSRLGRSAAVACLVFGLAGLVSTSAARASSIVYTKGNNIWIANSDGSGQYRVTTDGTAASAYDFPSEDKNGVIAARWDLYDLVRMRQNGQILSSFSPTPDRYAGASFRIPVSPVISPDGSKIAYFYDSYGCVDVDCALRTATEVSNSSQATDPSVYGRAVDLRNPVWVTGSRLMGFGGFQLEINLFDLGSSAQVWVTCDGDPACTNTSGPTATEGVLSPQHDKLAVVRAHPSDGTTHLALFNVSGDPTSGSPPPPPALICETTDNDPTLSSISFSPDGRQLIYSDSQGVWLMDFPSTLNSDGSNCGSITISVSPIIPGGSEARFGLPDNNPPPRGGSGGKHACHVPNLIGKKLGAARTALSRANCKLGKVTKRHTRPKNRGRVLSERPSAGAVRSAGAKVNLVVGK
jgi:PASTA domain/WD40-like Beta Propeller Repeat